MYILSFIVLLVNIPLFEALLPFFKGKHTCPPFNGREEWFGGNYGGTGGRQKVALGQGRINGISKWGLQDPAANDYPWLDYGVVIQGWSSDERTVRGSYGEFGSVDLIQECTPFQLSDDDYIIGYTVYYSSAYVYGLDFWTLSGDKHECHNDARNAEDGVTSTTEYYDCKRGFYYLTGFDMRTGLIIDSIKAQWTRAPQQCDCFETILVEESNDGQGSNCYEYQVNAVSEFKNAPVICRGDLDFIELGDGNADKKCGLSKDDLSSAVTSYSGPGTLEYTGIPKTRARDTGIRGHVRGYTVSGISAGDSFTICFDETKVSGTITAGNIGYRQVRTAEYSCKVEDTLFDLCPGSSAGNSVIGEVVFDEETARNVARDGSMTMMTIMRTALVSFIVSTTVVTIAYFVCIKPSTKTEVYDKVDVNV